MTVVQNTMSDTASEPLMNAIGITTAVEQALASPLHHGFALQNHLCQLNDAGAIVSLTGTNKYILKHTVTSP